MIYQLMFVLLSSCSITVNGESEEAKVSNDNLIDESIITDSLNTTDSLDTSDTLEFFFIKRMACAYQAEKKYGNRIVLKENVFCFYTPNYFKSLEDSVKFKMANELLSFKGDTSIVSLSVVCYSPLRSQIYMKDDNSYTVQLEALFILNQLFLDKPYNYSSFPVLVDKNSGSILHGYKSEQEKFDVIFTIYSDWIELIKKKKIDANTKFPLTASNFRWY